VNGLSAGYGGPAVVRDLSLHVHDKEAVALLGRNGAGKTTTLLTIAGALQASAGEVQLEGVPVVGRRTFEVARRGLTLVPQGRRIFPTLTVRENLTLGDRGGDLEAMYRLFPVLEARAHLPGSALSGGEQQMLALARGLMTRPRLLLLDEPSEGLAPGLVRELGELIVRLRAEQHLSILIAEQNLTLAFAVAERVYVLERGELAHEASAAAFQSDHSTQRRLLGV
jgi:branched-chain amino acid transport system ATP-binding protein